ncbi:DUF6270 domain-containing protein [Alteromonas sp. A079]|uniref:DUF6270 domain-containing protein n=1 Tax=Alteromonas sp. A079 TaxID=3410268 RepID=UPI003B9FB629
MRLVVYGSCVSRDALEYADFDCELVKYIARTSLATQQSIPVIKSDLLDALPSSFQRKMMRVDMEKSLLFLLDECDFELLLLDLIDERFSIGLFGAGRLTLTNEFLNVYPKNIEYLEWNRFSDEKFEAWCRGFNELMFVIRQKRNKPTVVLNKVYFAGYSGVDKNSAVECTSFMSTEVTRNNIFLNRMYEYIESNFIDVKILEYSDSLFIANPNHKWGLAPFHYIDELYDETMSKLSAFK